MGAVTPVRTRRRAQLIHASLGLLATACGGAAHQSAAPPASPTPREPLLILAASDLQYAMGELVPAYEGAGGRRPAVSLGSTGSFAAQIEQGAPADLFFAANESFVDDLERKGHLLTGTRLVYATGRIAVAPANGIEVKTLQDLLRSEVKVVAIANPAHAPYGLAAQQALQAAGIWEQVQPRLVLGENVSHTFQLVQTGNADAGIVALSIVTGVPGAAFTPVDDSLHAPLRQAAGVLARSRQPDEARAFLSFVNAAHGRAVLSKYGFRLPGE